MKKKLLTILVICIFILSLVGCDTDLHATYDNVKNHDSKDDDWADGYFTIIESWGGSGIHKYMIVYANDTKVMYYVDNISGSNGITPLYNSDGTIKIYNEE